MSRVLGRPAACLQRRRGLRGGRRLRCSPGGTPSPGTRPPAAPLNGATTIGAWRALGAAPRRGGCPRESRRKLRRLRARGRLPARGGGAQSRRAGPAAHRHLSRGAASRRAARDGRGGGAPRPGRRPRDLRPHPPRRAAPGRHGESRVARARRRAPGQLGQLDLRPRVPRPQPRREPLLARELRARRGCRLRRRCSSACCWIARTPSSRRRPSRRRPTPSPA